PAAAHPARPRGHGRSARRRRDRRDDLRQRLRPHRGHRAGACGPGGRCHGRRVRRWRRIRDRRGPARRRRTRAMNAGFDAPGILVRWRERLPLGERTPALSLGEGDPPLVHAPRLAEWVGVAELWLKFEGANPTGSFKDRGMVLAVARAIEAGAHTVLCASTGNTSASAAAYAAKAGIRAVVLLPADKVAAGKLAQAVACGARIGSVRGSFDDALALARTAAEQEGVA